MKDIDIFLAELNNPAIIFYDTSCILIDFKQIKIEACYQHRDFIEMVSRVINHEFLHYAIKESTDNQTSCKYDLIAKDLKEYWGW